MESPAVSGAQNYKELCLATKREERRLAELKKKQQYYLKSEKSQSRNSAGNSAINRLFTMSWHSRKGNEGIQQQKPLRCYTCDTPAHLACNCPQSKTESQGKKPTQTKGKNL